MLCSVYTTIAGEYDGPGFCTPIGGDTISVKGPSNKYIQVYHIPQDIVYEGHIKIYFICTQYN